MRLPPDRWVLRYPLFWAALALILGARLSSLIPAEALAPSVLVLLVIAFAAFGLGRLGAAGQQCGLYAAGLLLVLLGLGASRAYLATPSSGDALSEVAARESQPVAARGVITAAAVWRPNPNYRPDQPTSEPWKTQWTVRVESIRDGNAWRNAEAISTLYCAGRVDEFLPGDRIEWYGSYRRIHEPTNPGAFDFAAHSRQLGKFTMFAVDDRHQILRRGIRPAYLLQRLRGMAVKQVDRQLRRWVSHDQAPLAAALVFGQREQVDWDDQQELMATGTLHMLAISGMHVEIVAWGVLLVCSLASVHDHARLICLICLCGLYAALADGKPPVMRAAILVALFECSRCLGRKARLVNLLSVAAIALFFLRASNLDNVGVHLSFLAVATIGVFVIEDVSQQDTRKSALQRLLLESAGAQRRIVLIGWQWLRNMLRLSFWIWLITCPLVWNHFHVVSPVAIPLNVLIALPLAVSLLCGLFTGAVGWLDPLGWLAGSICGSGLALIKSLVACGKAIPYGHFWLPSPDPWWMAAFYVFVILWLIVFGPRRRGWLATILTAWLALGVLTAASKGRQGQSWLTPVSESNEVGWESKEDPTGSLSVTFLDVGHGSGVIVQEPQLGVWLYDAGHLGLRERSHQEIAGALWQLGTSHIDTLIISHADADHYNAVPGILERFSVGRVVSSPQFWTSEDRYARELIDRLRRERVPTQTWQAGDDGKIGDFSWRVLHPQKGDRWESDNAGSLCLLMNYRGKRILLPGDLEGSGLRTLTQLPARPCHVLMAPHHGSLTVDPSELLNWCQPELIVISGNHRAIRSEVLKTYSWPDAKLGVTFRDAAIQYRVSPQGKASVWHWRNGQWGEFSRQQPVGPD